MNDVIHDGMLDIAVRAGSMILENGGETYRAEETVVRIAYALGAKSASAFVTPTVVMFSYIDEEGVHRSSMKRVSRRVVNLKKIARVNDVSRRLARRGRTTNVIQIERLLDRIDTRSDYPDWLIVVMAAFSSLFFALMFGGGWREAVAALVIGFFLRVGLLFLDRFPLNTFIVSLVSGVVISVLSELALVSGFIPTSVITMTAVLMQVVPGLAIVNAIRDIIAGDLVSGTARLVEAFMIAAGLSIGSVAGVVIFARLAQ
jgi:uncharacterized membrane protein YjjP (DUF1212 family)